MKNPEREILPKSGSGLTETGSHRHRRNYLANSLYGMGESPQVNVFGSQLAARTVFEPCG
jgi:hypothetical protein